MRSIFFFRPMKWLSLSFSCLLVCCQSATDNEVTIQTGPDTFRRFSPVGAIAEYLEFPTEPDQLRISVANYPLSCDEYRRPQGDQVVVSFLLKAPTGQPLSQGSYFWKGLPAKEAELKEPLVLPYVRFSGGGRSLPPGGQFELISFTPEPFDQVVARSQLRGAEPGASYQIGVTATISARLCRVSLDENRRKLE